VKRLLSIAVTGALLAAALSASLASASSPVKLSLRKTSVGMILVNSRGFTLYAYTRDRRNQDSCLKVGGCVSVWPPLTTAGKPVAGSGVKASMLGTITIKGGAKQVTYGGHPLYTYVGDTGPGSIEYVNVSASGGRWPALSGSGSEVK
jgi:predicted lipoprotein with Yx(FWY)xxD motif